MKKILLYLIVCITLVSLASADLTDDLAHFYTFDGVNISGTTMFDLMDGNINVTFSGNPTYNVTGVINESVDLDGAGDYGSLVSQPAINDTEATINLWFNTSASPDNSVLIMNRHAGAARGVWISSGANYLQFQLSSTPTLFDNVSVEDGEWHMVTIMVANNWQAIWLDATLYLNETGITPDAEIGDVWKIGRNDDFAPARDFVGQIDLVSMYNRTLTQAEITQLNNSGNGFNPLIQTVPPTINSNSTSPDPIILNTTTTITFNVTNDNGTSLDWVNLTLYNTTGGLIINNSNGTQSGDLWTWNFTPQETGDLNWSIVARDNNSDNATATGSFTIYPYIIGNLTYDLTLLETQSTDFSFFIFYQPPLFTNITASLNWNGTSYPSTQIDSNPYFNYSNNLIVPSFNLTSNATIPFNWSISLQYSNSTTATTNTSSQNQTIIPLNFSNCNGSFRFILRDTNTNNNLTGDFQATFNIWSYNRSLYKTYSFDLEDRINYDFCMLPNSTTLYTDAYIQYTVDGGFTHRYYLINNSVTNVTETIYLYNHNTTTGISDLKGTARYESNYSYYVGIYARLQQYYLAEDVWRTIQMDRAGDFGGLFFNIEEQNKDYRIMFQDDNARIVRLTDSMKFVCTATVCELTFLLNPYEATAAASGLSLNWSYADGNFTIEWNNTLGAFSTVRTLVRKDTMTGAVDVCDTTQTASSGNLICDASAYTGEAFLFIEGDDTVLYSEWEELTSPTISTLITQAEGAIWTFAIMLTVVMFGIVISPVASIITAIFGLVILFFLGLTNIITVTFIIVACVMGVIISIKIKK